MTRPEQQNQIEYLLKALDEIVVNLHKVNLTIIDEEEQDDYCGCCAPHNTED